MVAVILSCFVKSLSLKGHKESSYIPSNTQVDHRTIASSKTCLSAKAPSCPPFISVLAGCGIF